VVVIRKVPKFFVGGLNATEPVAVAPSLNVTPVSVKSIGTAWLEWANVRLPRIASKAKTDRVFGNDLVFIF